MLDKPHAKGGFAFSRYEASAILTVLIIVCIVLLPQRPAGRAEGPETTAIQG